MSESIKESLLDLYKDESGQQPNAMIDPATAIMLLEVVLELIKMFKACRESKESAMKRMRKQSIIDRAIFKRFLKNKLGVKKLKADPAIQATIERFGKVVSSEELEELWKS